MLLTELILSKRGPLAKVWLSAHHERKLSKQQALGVDVNESVDAILEDTEPMALRVSGQLMLGVVRIYGRKVQYLMDDCRDTRERISLAFRPGMVDLPDDQKRASRNAITFESAPGDALDILDWSFVPPPATEARGLHTAPLTQTNLRSREYGAFNFGRPRQPSIYGEGSSRQGSHDTPSHLESDFAPIDLGLDLDMDMDLGADAFDMSMEVGRDAASDRARSQSKSATPLRLSEARDAPPAWDESFAPIDLGLEDLPELEDDSGAARARRETSALSTPPPPDREDGDGAPSPGMAKRLAAHAAGPKPKRVRLRILHADEELELSDSEFPNPAAGESDILSEPRYIPTNPEASRLRDIIDDPAGHFLPTQRVGADTLIYTGPTGVAPELAELFAFRSTVLRRRLEPEPARAAPAESSEPEDAEVAAAAPRPAKKQRIAPPREDDDYEMEVARRQSTQAQAKAHSPIDLQLDFGDDAGGFGDISLDIHTPPREPSLALSLSRGSMPPAPMVEGNKLAGFDTRIRNSQGEMESQQASQAAASQAQAQAQTQEEEGGYSKTTGMAMGVLRREIEAIEADSKGAKEVQFDEVARGASKRAATAFFFELLVLGTRDAVALRQGEAFGPIGVMGKERLWA